MSTLLNEKEAALRLGCSIYKLQKDRRIGSPIPFLKIGRSVRYQIEDIDAYMERQRFTSTMEYVGGRDDG
ncbi:helix-turn-helix domain-containing protein [Sneathiella chungangensis]|uniref:Helix-turn-helix domain-containing protein n=1 Tax=Sneathiella chungangensis TaxID=1418234 RepID=A0A845MIR9_9PROT|nr:helix-turn-helix domain-containing protein [Sneathiella chungangensis]MZR23933.1 helix-turn-helix domain-containing protein [Sneathiella chungangensis]